jgi:c-di-GMP-binding flagellar brake protein YcgR
MGTSTVHTGQCAVQIWERLQLTIGDDAEQGVYSCRVSDIKEDRLIISRPVFEYGHTLMTDNRPVTASFTRADAAYSFRAHLKEMTPKSADAMYLLDPGEVSRIQRRRFVRLDLGVPFRYAVLPRPIRAAVSLTDQPYDSVRTINISAGGVLIPVGKQASAGSILILVATDNRLKKLPKFLLGVCRQYRTLDNNRTVAGLEFMLNEYIDRYFSADELRFVPDEVSHFDFRAQNDLAGELFAEQLVLRQKGLL